MTATFQTSDQIYGTMDARHTVAYTPMSTMYASQAAVTGATHVNTREVAFTGDLLDRSNEPLGHRLLGNDANFAQPTTMPRQTDQRELLERVFGGPLHPQEAAVNQAIGANEASFVDEKDPTTFTSRQYFNNPGLVGRIYDQGQSSVGPPEDAMFATVSAHGGQPIYRYNNFTNADERQDTAVLSLDGNLDDGLKDILEQYGPPPHAGSADLLNHINVRVPLSARYTGPWDMDGASEPRVHFAHESQRSSKGVDQFRPQRDGLPGPDPTRVAQADTSEQIEKEITTVNGPDAEVQPLPAQSQSDPTRRFEDVAGSFV